MNRFAWPVVLLLLLGCRAEKKTANITANLNKANKVTTRSVLLFYESADSQLVPESRSIPLPENDAAALNVVVKELLKGSANSSIPRLLPEDAVVRGAYLLADGTAFIDLGGVTLVNGWNTGSHHELMAVYSVVQTAMSNFRSVRRVRILVNGQPAETLAGHIGLGRSLTPMAWLARAE